MLYAQDEGVRVGEQVATRAQRAIFRRRLQQARADAGMSQRELARQVGVSSGAVSQWEMGEAAPREDTTHKLEQVLNLEEGTLSRLIGHLPLGVQQDAISSVMEAVDADPRLGDRERELLATMYRELVRQRGEEREGHDEHPGEG